MNDDFKLTAHLPISSTGVLWDLEEAAFLRWWRALPSIDRDEFTRMYQGEELLARFVCALHHMETQQDTALEPGVIVSAYAIAARLNPSKPETRIRAAKAWRSDAVQTLWSRLHQRAAEQTKIRIMNSVGYLLEVAIQDAITGSDNKERALIAQAALKFATLVSVREAEDRAETRKRGASNLQSLEQKELSGETEVPNPTTAETYMRMLKQSLGPQFDAIAAKIVDKELT